MSETEDEIVRRLCSIEAPLSQRLATFSRYLSANEPEFAEAYDELAARLAAVRAGSTAPDIGEEMPGFRLPDGRGQLHALNDMLSSGAVVVSFNRGHWCPYCKVELSAFKQAHREIAATGARVVSIMPEMPQYVAKVSQEIDNVFTVLCDEGNGYALACNLVIWLGERIRHLQDLEFSLEKSQGNGAYFVPIPATFVVASDGTVIARKIDPDFRHRMDIEDILKALRHAKS
jgi:peroxiredoxin